MCPNICLASKMQAFHRGLECCVTAKDLPRNVFSPSCRARPRKAKSCGFPYSVLTAGYYPFSSSALQCFSLPEQKSLNCWLINPRVLLRASLPNRKCRPLLRSPSTQWAYERRRPVEMALLGDRYAVWAALLAKAWRLFSKDIKTTVSRHVQVEDFLFVLS